MKRFSLVWLLSVVPVVASTWTVSPTGNDRAAGTPNAPLATIPEALRRAAKRTDGNSEIILKAGTYPLLTTAEINATHASAKVGTLTLRGETGVVLSGFRNVPTAAWKKTDFFTAAQLRPEVKAKVLEVSLMSVGTGDPGRLSRRGFNVDEVRETPPAVLFVDGKPQPLAGWPDGNVAKPGAIVSAGPTRDGADSKNFYKRGGTFRFGSDRLAAWSRETNLWVDGTFGYDWEWSFNQVKSVNGLFKTITLAYGEVNGLLDYEWLHPGFRVVNALSEISTPGEYYYDSARRRVVLLPPAAGETWKKSASFTWANVPLLRVKGAQGFRLENVTLEGARDGLMEIKSSRDVAVQGTVFRRNGGDGLVADGTRITLSDCRFEDCGGIGAKLSGGTEVTLEPSGHVVERCVFQRNAWWSHVFLASLELKGVGHEVKECQFLDLPHMGIAVKGNNFLIEDNLFRRTCRDFRDMGAVYISLGDNPLQRGTVIRGNFFDEIGTQGGNRSAVYLDNANMGVTIEENLFRHVGATDGDWTVMVHGGGYNQVVRNVFLDCPLPCEVAFLFETWAKDLLPEYVKTWTSVMTRPDAAARIQAYPELAGFLSEDHVHPPGIVVAENVVLYSGGAPSYGALRVEGGGAADAGESGNILQATTVNAVDGLEATDGLPDFAKELLDAWRE